MAPGTYAAMPLPHRQIHFLKGAKLKNIESINVSSALVAGLIEKSGRLTS